MDWRMPDNLLDDLARPELGPFQPPRPCRHMIIINIVNNTHGVVDGGTLKATESSSLAAIVKGERVKPLEIRDGVVRVDDIKPKTSRQLLLWTTFRPLAAIDQAFIFRSKQSFRVRYDVIDIDAQRGKYRVILSTKDIIGWLVILFMVSAMIPIAYKLLSSPLP